MITQTLIKKVFIFTGKVTHLIDLNAPRNPEQPRERSTSFCGYTPMWPAYWLFADSIEWQGTEVDGFPLCKTCEQVREALGDAG